MVWCGRWAYAMPVCLQFMYGIVFKMSADAIIDHSQSAKDIDPYFKSQLYWRTPVIESWYSLYRMGWVMPKSERTTEINFRRGLNSNPQPADQCLTTRPSPLQCISHCSHIEHQEYRQFYTYLRLQLAVDIATIYCRMCRMWQALSHESFAKQNALSQVLSMASIVTCVVCSMHVSQV